MNGLYKNASYNKTTYPPSVSYFCLPIGLYALIDRRHSAQGWVGDEKFFKKKMQQPAIRYGLLGAFAVIIWFSIAYGIDKQLFLHPALQWGALLVYACCMYLAARAELHQAHAPVEFRQRTRTPFLVFLLINLAYWLLYYGLHLYDPALIQMELTQKMDYLQKMLDAGLGDPEQANQVRTQIQDLQKAIDKPLPQPLAPVVVQMLQGAIGGFVLAAGITALLWQRTPQQSI